MFGAKVDMSQTKELKKKVDTATDKASFKNIRHASFSIRKIATGSIKKSGDPSSPGEPPATRLERGHNLRGAIFVAADKESGIIGPRHTWVSNVGEYHELGKSRDEIDFDERPFMGPALEQQRSRFAADWAGSIGE